MRGHSLSSNNVTFFIFGLSEFTKKKHVFGSFNLSNSENYRLSFEDILWGTLDTHTKKLGPPSTVWWGGGYTIRSVGS